MLTIEQLDKLYAETKEGKYISFHAAISANSHYDIFAAMDIALDYEAGNYMANNDYWLGVEKAVAELRGGFNIYYPTIAICLAFMLFMELIGWQLLGL